MSELKKPISIKQAMSLLDVSRPTIERRVKEGTLQKFYLGSKPYLDLEQIEKAFTKQSH
jgi:predicted DNA-binding transcriptional regulator AlpA